MSELSPENEYEALMHVVQRLSERFPEVTEERLRELTVKEFETFDGAHVRDFVPVLVERSVTEKLRAGMTPAA